MCPPAGDACKYSLNPAKVFAATAVRHATSSGLGDAAEIVSAGGVLVGVAEDGCRVGDGGASGVGGDGGGTCKGTDNSGFTADFTGCESMDGAAGDVAVAVCCASNASDEGARASSLR